MFPLSPSPLLSLHHFPSPSLSSPSLSPFPRCLSLPYNLFLFLSLPLQSLQTLDPQCSTCHPPWGSLPCNWWQLFLFKNVVTVATLTAAPLVVTIVIEWVLISRKVVSAMRKQDWITCAGTQPASLSTLTEASGCLVNIEMRFPLSYYIYVCISAMQHLICLSSDVEMLQWSHLICVSLVIYTHHTHTPHTHTHTICIDRLVYSITFTIYGNSRLTGLDWQRSLVPLLPCASWGGGTVAPWWSLHTASQI